MNANGIKGILTAGAKEGFHPVNMRVSACSSATPFSTPLEHRKAVRTSGGHIILLGKRNGYRLNSFFYGLLMVFIASLLAEPTLVQLRFDSAGLHSLTEPSWLVNPPQGRGQLWARNPTRSPTLWPTFLGVDGFHEDNGVSEKCL